MLQVKIGEIYEFYIEKKVCNKFFNKVSSLIELVNQSKKIYFRKNFVYFKDYCYLGDESYEVSDEDKGSN